MQGQTSPEELLAAAHASCFSMALSAELGRAGSKPERLEVTCTVTFDKADGGYRVSSSVLDVRGTVPGVDPVRFRSAADAAGEKCPISQALRGVNIEVRSQLAESPSQQQPQPGL